MANSSDESPPLDLEGLTATEVDLESVTASDIHRRVERVPPTIGLFSEAEPFSDGHLEAQRENVRGSLAKALTLVLAITVVASFATLWARVDSVTPADLKDLVTVILGPIAALVGSATGFYFGRSGDLAGRSNDSAKKPKKPR